jgi:hypothetical protein
VRQILKRGYNEGWTNAPRLISMVASTRSTPSGCYLSTMLVSCCAFFADSLVTSSEVEALVCRLGVQSKLCLADEPKQRLWWIIKERKSETTSKKRLYHQGKRWQQSHGSWRISSLPYKSAMSATMHVQPWDSCVLVR